MGPAGGLVNPGEIQAEDAAREMQEEAGLPVEPYALVDVYDSRLCGSGSKLQLYTFRREWTAEQDGRDLSTGHHVRVPDAFSCRREDRPAYLDLA